MTMHRSVDKVCKWILAECIPGCMRIPVCLVLYLVQWRLSHCLEQTVPGCTLHLLEEKKYERDEENLKRMLNGRYHSLVVKHR